MSLRAQPSNRRHATGARFVPISDVFYRIDRRGLTRIESLCELRARRGVTQRRVAENLGLLQSTISKIEGRGEFDLRTLRGYVGAMGGDLLVVAWFGAELFELDVFGRGRAAAFSLGASGPVRAKRALRRARRLKAR
jgi:transcriptional regulator with XRE-family HTH domain